VQNHLHRLDGLHRTLVRHPQPPARASPRPA
jgi:hypothetical protein